MRVIDVLGKANIPDAEDLVIPEVGGTIEPSSTVAIYASHVLQHLPMQPDVFFSIAWEMLKPSGFLAFLVPLAPYKNAFTDNPKRFFTNDMLYKMIDQSKWKILNYDVEVAKGDENDPNTWDSTAAVRLQPIKD